MKQEYIKPDSVVFRIESEVVICGSDAHPYICNNDCKNWHICRDRDTTRGNYCPDKEYKY